MYIYIYNTKTGKERGRRERESYELYCSGAVAVLCAVAVASDGLCLCTVWLVCCVSLCLCV